MKYNIISHVTTACNYDCSYCDVIKDKRNISQELREEIVEFIKRNQKHISRFKFFGWEPLLAFRDISYIIDSTQEYLGKNYEMVTNTSLLKDIHGPYFETYFSHIFFSIDSENDFNYEKVCAFIETYKLQKNLYFNLIVSPGKHEQAYEQFTKLYDVWMRGFNILPVYFTQEWSDIQLSDFSSMMKTVLDTSLKDESLRLYGFKENLWYDTSLANNTIFIDVDGEVYYSDITSTFSGEKIKKHLHIWNVRELHLSDLEDTEFRKQKKYISMLEKSIYNSVNGQYKLHKIMDYFSEYLNKKNN